ncbi:methyltransferase domain-containing protein [Negadavirga shengliensis]|uniref:Methyltransferase domain-containing protein n=1 Tax=Negadavirga shengliensis TaxID=1389218 RepID=A0ABV9T2U1_9BACT
MGKVTDFILEQIVRIGKKVKNNPKIRSILYKNRNENIFASVDQHERMLADNIRVNTYHDAIQKNVKPGDTVVDLGSGTGVLSFFALKKSPKMVYAVDHGNIIELARFLAKKNNFTDISFVKSHSRDFDPEEKIDVIIHEQIGDFLLDEDMVRNLCDLRDRLLKPGGKILPSRFELFFEPISLKKGHRTPYIWEQQLHGVDFHGAKRWLLGSENKIGKAKSHCRLMPGDQGLFHCEPEPILSFDLMKTDPANFPKKMHFTKRVNMAGTMDGFCLYFNIQFDEELCISTNPFLEPTHWHSQIFRTEPTGVEEGDVIEAELVINDHTKVSSWTFDHRIFKTVFSSGDN